MGDSLTTIIAIFLAALLLFVFPLMTVAERSDDITQLNLQTATDEFVDNVRQTGVFKLEDWTKYIEQISSVGGVVPEPSSVLYILDENPGVKTTQAEMTKIGENVYYKFYTSQIEEELKRSENGNKIVLKQGDRIEVSVKNTNKTMAQILRNFFYSLSGNNAYEIAAKHGGVVTVNGSR